MASCPMSASFRAVIGESASSIREETQPASGSSRSGDGLGGVPERVLDVGGLEVRVGVEYLIGADSVRDHSEHGRDGDP